MDIYTLDPFRSGKKFTLRRRIQLSSSLLPRDHQQEVGELWRVAYVDLEQHDTSLTCLRYTVEEVEGLDGSNSKLRFEDPLVVEAGKVWVRRGLCWLILSLIKSAEHTNRPPIPAMGPISLATDDQGHTFILSLPSLESAAPVPITTNMPTRTEDSSREVPPSSSMDYTYINKDSGIDYSQRTVASSADSQEVPPTTQELEVVEEEDPRILSPAVLEDLRQRYNDSSSSFEESWVRRQLFLVPALFPLRAGKV